MKRISSPMLKTLKRWFFLLLVAPLLIQCSLDYDASPAGNAVLGAMLTGYNVDLTEAGSEVKRGGSGSPTGGTIESLILSTYSLDFGNVQAGQSKSLKTFTIENIGGDELSVSITVKGRDASQFKISPASFPLNTKRTVTAVFTPTSEGTKSASLSIAYKERVKNVVVPVLPSVSLSGNGTPPPPR